MPVTSKQLCACSCNTNVTQKTKLQHQLAKGPSTLTSTILTQNWMLIGGHKKWTSSQLAGHCATVCNVLNAPHCPAHTSVSSHHNIPDHLPNDNYPMDDAGPSGVCHNALMLHSPPPRLRNNGNVDDDNISALSTTCHSQHVAEHVKQIGQ